MLCVLGAGQLHTPSVRGRNTCAGLGRENLCGMQGTALQEGEIVLHNLDVCAEARHKASISEQAASNVQDR